LIGAVAVGLGIGGAVAGVLVVRYIIQQKEIRKMEKKIRKLELNK